MFAKWYLVLFVLSLIVLLFVLSYNIYEYLQNKNNLKSTTESQDILFWFNVGALVLVVILVLGFFFSRDRKCEKLQQGVKITGQPIINQVPVIQTPVLQTHSPVILNQSPVNQTHILPQQKIQTAALNPPLQNQVIPNISHNNQQLIGNRYAIDNFKNSECNGNPFGCEGNIDIISRV